MIKPTPEIKNLDWPRIMKEIKETPESEVDKVATAFGRITQHIIDLTWQEIELARALKDQETVIKHQIKMEVMKSARHIFHDCYKHLVGRKAWHE
ncbi:hypothetical protein ACFL27_10800 [candidate division CSSED10-310 bacterium]|uniref:Uncharacterized protein n=1 Tax=candidate division CSSED10-310 bacterium TaxID=2855610 RepID=A0ABV6YWT5_UNCC1